MDLAGKPGKRVEPATVKEVVDLAVEIDKQTADSRWCEDVDLFEQLRNTIRDLEMAIIFLPKTPQQDLLKRLAIADAERLRGSLLMFERTLDSMEAKPPITSKELLKRAAEVGDILNVAASAFIAIAIGVE